MTERVPRSPFVACTAAYKVVSIMPLYREIAVTEIRNRGVALSGDEASGRASAGSSLLPMLVVGLVLIVIGAAVVMAVV